MVVAKSLMFALIGLFSSMVYGAPGSIKQIVPDGRLNTVALGVGMGEKLLLVTRSGDLLRIDPTTGKSQTLKTAVFPATRMLFSVDAKLYLVNKNGDLLFVSTSTGDSRRIGKKGAFRAAISAVGHDAKIYSVERDGKLYRTNPSDGKWAIVGNPTFKNTRWMYAFDTGINTIERVGAMYRVHPKTGRWQRTGQFGAWAATITGVSMYGNLYTIEQDGKLYVTDPSTGVYQQIGKRRYKSIRVLMGLAGYLYGIDNKGALLRIVVH